MRELPVEAEFVYSRHAAAEMSVAYGILVPQRRARTAAPAGEGKAVTAAAIYARVSSARQAKDQTIGSQLSALREHAGQGLTCPGRVGLRRRGALRRDAGPPQGLEALRDLAAQGCLDVVLVYSPDRLARKFAYQALLIEELARCENRVEFVKGPRGDSPEDQLLVQFQGMFAEYEKAQLMERYRRGKAWRAKTGSVNVLGGAPFGYGSATKTPESGARYEVIPHEAVLVAEMFRRYADDGAAIADLGRWLTAEGVATRTGKEKWDRSVIWGMLRNPAYAGTAVFGKTRVHPPAARLTPASPAAAVPRQRDQERAPGRNGPASPSWPWWTRRPSTGPSSGWLTTSGSPRGTRRSRRCCRASPPARPAATATTAPPRPRPPGTRSTTTGASAPTTTATRADASARTSPSAPTTPNKVVWDHVTALLADPALIRAEIGKRLERARTSNRSPASAPSSSRPSRRPARRSPR